MVSIKSGIRTITMEEISQEFEEILMETVGWFDLIIQDDSDLIITLEDWGQVNVRKQFAKRLTYSIFLFDEGSIENSGLWKQGEEVAQSKGNELYLNPNNISDGCNKIITDAIDFYAKTTEEKIALENGELTQFSVKNFFNELIKERLADELDGNKILFGNNSMLISENEDDLLITFTFTNPFDGEYYSNKKEYDLSRFDLNNPKQKQSLSLYNAIIRDKYYFTNEAKKSLLNTTIFPVLHNTSKRIAKFQDVTPISVYNQNAMIVVNIKDIIVNLTLTESDIQKGFVSCSFSYAKDFKNGKTKISNPEEYKFPADETIINRILDVGFRLTLLDKRNILIAYKNGFYLSKQMKKTFKSKAEFKSIADKLFSADIASEIKAIYWDKYTFKV